jgi:hypothetical protein
MSTLFLKKEPKFKDYTCNLTLISSNLFFKPNTSINLTYHKPIANTHHIISFRRLFIGPKKERKKVVYWFFGTPLD